ncbi:MAG: hypothetical protein D6731_02770 [Planctomycetota bacterium]|nr:MAG: hypothetical protein D6731_02770 [Planctomycetota bacterium]
MIGQLWTVATLELRQAIGGAKILVVVLMLFALAALAFAVRALATPPPELGPEAFWPAIYLLMLNFVFLQTTVILVPLAFATSLLRNDIDQGTLVYLWTRPVPRPTLLLAKFLAASAVSAGLLVVGMGLFCLAFLLPGGDPSGGAFDWLGRTVDFMAAAVLGAVGYGALFALFGLVFRRGLIWGIAYGFLSEFVLTNFPAVVREVTVMHYLRAVALSGVDVRSLGLRFDPEDLAEVERLLGFLDPPSAASAWATVLLLAGACLVLSACVVRAREYCAAPARPE